MWLPSAPLQPTPTPTHQTLFTPGKDLLTELTYRTSGTACIELPPVCAKCSMRHRLGCSWQVRHAQVRSNQVSKKLTHTRTQRNLVHMRTAAVMARHSNVPDSGQTCYSHSWSHSECRHMPASTHATRCDSQTQHARRKTKTIQIRCCRQQHFLEASKVVCASSLCQYPGHQTICMWHGTSTYQC